MTSKCIFILGVSPSNTVALFPVEIANLLKLTTASAIKISDEGRERKDEKL